MGEHRVDQLAARRQPQPKPLAQEPVDPFGEGLPAAPRRRAGRARSTWRGGRRRLTAGLHTRTGRWTLIAVAGVVVLLIGLIAQGAFSSSGSATGSPDGADATPHVVAGNGLPTAPPSKSGSSSKSAGANGGLVKDPVKALRDAFPDNPLNHLDRHGLHEVTISATSAGNMPVVGYLVPTGLGSAYGSVHTHSGHWSLHEQALGKGYLAALFIQADKLGLPVTCTVTVDGKVTSSESTSGSYGRAVCLG